MIVISCMSLSIYSLNVRCMERSHRDREIPHTRRYTHTHIHRHRTQTQTNRLPDERPQTQSRRRNPGQWWRPSHSSTHPRSSVVVAGRGGHRVVAGQGQRRRGEKGRGEQRGGERDGSHHGTWFIVECVCVFCEGGWCSHA